MPETNIRDGAGEIVAAAVRDVLETMFFTMVVEEGEAPEDEPGRELTVRLRFRGDPPGVLQVSLSEAAAHSIAATFLGADEGGELAETGICGVIGEMTNMICGASLSELESGTIFDLESPEVVTEAEPLSGEDVIHCTLPLECGVLRVDLLMEPDR